MRTLAKTAAAMISLAALCFLFAVTGCGTETGEPWTPKQRRQRSLAQLKGGGCLQGFELFADGKCYMRYDCEQATDCLAGLECFDGYCLGSSCKTDADCPSVPWKWICYAGQCIDAACKVDADCAQGATCKAGHCYGGCDPTCSVGTTCIDGLCLQD